MGHITSVLQRPPSQRDPRDDHLRLRWAWQGHGCRGDHYIAVWEAWNA